ncbi:MAG: hypothetical protein WCS70_16445, partial [Verrucomicrobiota bacterium]
LCYFHDCAVGGAVLGPNIIISPYSAASAGYVVGRIHGESVRLAECCVNRNHNRLHGEVGLPIRLDANPVVWKYRAGNTLTE